MMDGGASDVNCVHRFLHNPILPSPALKVAICAVLPLFFAASFSEVLRAEETADQRRALAGLTVDTQPQQRCGVMLGGVGTGYMELWPDGCFHDWGIFNRGRWGYRGDFMEKDQADRLPLAEMNAEALQFFVRSQASKGEPIVRRLSTNGELMNVYSYNTWLQSVAGISFDSTFPGAHLQYKDSTLPVKVSAAFFSPFIPHELQIAGTPGFYAVFTIKNTSQETQEVSLAAYLRNPLARGGAAANRGADVRKLRTTVTMDKETTYLTMRTEAGEPFQTTLGNMCLSTSGGKPSWIAMDFGEFLIGRTINVKPWNQRYETVFRDFRTTGVLPNTEGQPCPTTLGVLKVAGSEAVNMHIMPAGQSPAPAGKAQIDALTDEQVAQIIEQAMKVPSLRSIVAQAKAVDPNLLVATKNGRELVGYLMQAVGQLAGEDGKAVNWGDGMLCSSLTLKPGEERQVRMTLSWFFPNHPSPFDGRNMGHMYANSFKDAEDVNRFLGKNYDEFARRVRVFQNALKETTLPVDLMAAVSSQLNTLVCSSWWIQDDKMGMWEGLGTIGQNTVDVAYQGSHPISSLFPQWAKSWTRLASTYQNEETGRLYHSLPNDMNQGGTDHGYGYVDVNCHFAIMLGRDYLWFGDKDYLEFFYPHVAREIGVFEGMDSDGDCLPDQKTSSNTYDTWDLHGTPSYLCSIWITALRVGIRMAEDSGDTQNATKWKAMLAKALTSLEQKLWNGEYYSLWVDGDLRDDACMTDQLSGEMYAKLIGMGNAVPVERVQSALRAIYKYNFTPEQGLFNGTYPAGRQPRMPTYRNVQAEGNWTGIEYASAAMMIDQGMVEEGLAVVKAINRRYLRAGRLYNHEECGPHYYRPLSVWSTLLAATGFKVDTPRGILTIAPPVKQEKLQAPWVSATGLGQFTRTGHSFELACHDGETNFREFRVNVAGVKTATLEGKPLSCTVKVVDGLSVFQFEKPVVLKPGQTLSLQ